MQILRNKAYQQAKTCKVDRFDIMQELKKGIKGNPQLALRYLESNRKQESKINENQKLNMTNEQKQKELGLNDKQKELGLNDKQAEFCKEYVSNLFNATQAYLSVYKPKSEISAKTNGARLLTNDNVCIFVEFLKKPRDLQFEITRESQLKELDRIKELAQIPDASGKVQWASVVKIVEVQNKMLGLDAPTKLEIMGKDGGAVQVEATITAVNFLDS